MIDTTSFWAFVQKRKNLSAQLLIALLIFGGGWQLGKIMSPYYATSPIIFNDRECENQSSSGGSGGELTELKEDGIEAKKQADAKKQEKINIASTPPKAEVAGTATARTTTKQKKFVGSVNSNLFHDPTCSSSKRIKEENMIWFTSQEEAGTAGYSASKCTKEKLGI
jgi:hypothetical protein